MANKNDFQTGSAQVHRYDYDRLSVLSDEEYIEDSRREPTSSGTPSNQLATLHLKGQAKEVNLILVLATLPLEAHP